MKILAIETSCDDTGIAILEISGNKKSLPFNVLANKIASQIEVHKQYGGVYPLMAKREHEKNLAPTLEIALKEAKVLLKNINLIAVTNGPGLEPCLWVGVNFAKNLAQKLGIPLVPVNHIEGHILVNFLQTTNYKLQTKLFPALCLVVSGGHTQLILMKNLGKYKIIGETRDDAAGECFDKCAKILGLSYPGGPAIAEFARQWKSEARNPKSEIKLPRPMLHTKDYDFSFSGLKTAVLYKVRDDGKKAKTLKYKKQMASEVQQAIIDVLIKKTIKAVKDFKVKTLILGGGVTANKELRKQFLEKVVNFAGAKNTTIYERQKIKLLIPPANLSTDNGLMVAVAGYFRRNKKIAWQKLQANANLRVS